MVAETGTDDARTDRRGAETVRYSALLIGSVAACSVALTQVVPELLFGVLFSTSSDPATGAGATWVASIAESLWFVGTRAMPLLAVLLAFHLTAVRELPAAPVAAGAFLGALLAPIGFVLGEVYVRPLDTALVSGEAFYTFATLTVFFVVPVLLATALGALFEDRFEPGARWRGLRS